MISETEFLRAYDDLSDALFRHCYFRIYDRELSKDLVQDTFIKTWEYIMGGGEIDNVRAFLYRVLTNLIIDFSRKRKKNSALSLETLAEQGFDLRFEDNLNERACITAEVKECLSLFNRLDDKDRVPVLMRYLDELSPKEIANILGDNENAVSVRIHRGIKKVRDILGDSKR